MSEIRIEKIIRSKRKTIELQITDNVALIVRAPFGMDEKKIFDVIKKHSKWIDNKKKEIEARDPKVLKKEFVNGEGFLYLGKYYKLYIVDNQKIPLKFENGFYLSRDYLDKAKEVFIDWYKKEAFIKISERVNWYAKKSNLKYKKVNITYAQKRWGSCSLNGNLNFSWKLIMAPVSVIDYVIVHELAHLEERNHGKNFWVKVKMLMPDYKKHADWLKKNGYSLNL
ncbi:M48 family metallopeptidase [Athalassotoga saccharophila]|uniref:M48 family metallopeptidase n=1 Tax=Athalassotoga saccharophila TaxID=1441386 RepID=UPI001379EBC4|nr:SprT family zinc-dependent metalloprotease [Athalassotoga saccharophila]BBJ28607.1 metal-dependent hydrolase [Athalassotoga saccharophila]